MAAFVSRYANAFLDVVTSAKLFLALGKVVPNCGNSL